MTELSKKHQYLVLAATSLGVLMNPLLASMIILALPHVLSSLGRRGSHATVVLLF